MIRTFLIADDSQWKRDMLSRLVKNMEICNELKIAKTTEEADEVIDASDEITFAFIDYEIPTKNGPAIIKNLRAKFPGCLIALVTASDNVKYKEDAMNAGANAFVCTAKSEDELENELNDLLIAWKAQRE